MASTHDFAASYDDQPVSYKDPPVTEVYISVQTNTNVFPDADFGRLAKVFSSRFPKLNVQPRLDRLVEGAPGPAPALTFEFVPTVGQRFWFISSDDTRVVQIQNDRFVYNWRKRSSDSDYPRYKQIRVEFEEALGSLLTELGVQGTDLIDFCEISYINHIDLPEVEDVRSQVHRIFRHLDLVNLDLAKMALEESSFVWTFSVADEQDQFVGRMRISTTPAFRPSSQKFIIQNQITFRGRPADGSVSSALSFCDRGHFAIVSAFDRITTEEMHKLWGKTG